MSSPPRGDFVSSTSGFGSASPFRGSPYIEEDNPFADLAPSRNTPPVSVLQTPSMPPPGTFLSLPPFPPSQWKSYGIVATSPGFGTPSSQPSSHSTSTQQRQTSTSTPRTPSSTKQPSPITSRRRPTGSRLGQSVISKLEDLDLESDPLGPLGETSPETVAPPPPPAKDDSPSTRTPRQPPTTFAEIKSDFVETPRLAETRPTQPQAPPGVSRQLSMPLEQAAQPPTFNITVGDPTTIGNITGSHTEYKVRTRVPANEQRVD